MALLKRKETRYFCWFLFLGALNVVVVRSWFVPDEYWQSLEISHKLIFGYGFLTWEWAIGLRSYFYPALFAVVYKLLQITNLDYLEFLIYIPRLLQCLITCTSYLFVLRFASSFYRDLSVVFWVNFSLSSSWVLFYVMSRTLINTLETNLLMIAISFYPWKFSYSRVNHLKFILFSAICCLFRPTCFIFLFPLIIYHVIYYFHRVFHLYFIIGLISIFSQISIDSYCYGFPIFTPFVFFRFNFLMPSISSHFGTSSPLWFLFIGFPILTSSHLIPFICACFNWKKHLPLLLIISWNVFIYSFVSHKEFRFILPVLPLVCCIVGSLLNDLQKKKSALCRIFSFWLLITNLPAGFYFSWIHQSGPLNVVNHLSKSPEVESIFFLMPCHSTPGYSHFHRNISLTYLNCDPDLTGSSNYEDEADLFHRNPEFFLYNYFQDKRRKLPTHLVMFDSLSPVIATFLKREDYKQCNKYFHAHFSDPRRGNYVQVYCRDKVN